MESPAIIVFMVAYEGKKYHIQGSLEAVFDLMFMPPATSLDLIFITQCLINFFRSQNL